MKVFAVIMFIVSCIDLYVCFHSCEKVREEEEDVYRPRRSGLYEVVHQRSVPAGDEPWVGGVMITRIVSVYCDKCQKLLKAGDIFLEPTLSVRWAELNLEYTDWGTEIKEQKQFCAECGNAVLDALGMSGMRKKVREEEEDV